MKRGPKPKPTHLKLLQGNPGKRPLNQHEPEPELPPAPPDPPKVLTGYGKEEWIRIATELFRLRLLSTFDIYPLAAYCQAYHSWRTAVEKLETMAERDPAMAALLMKTQKGTVVQNPLFVAVRQSASDMVRYASEFGFTPAARSRIDSIEVVKTKDKFSGLFGSQKDY